MKWSGLLLLASAVMSSGSITSSKQNVAFAAAAALAEDGEQQETSTESEERTELPQLPEPPKDSKLPSIKLGETIRFEEMGPVILNVDGSMRRIDNWDDMTEHEKEVSWRRISKRNEQRRKQLLEKEHQEGSDTKQGDEL